jgi:hypothetical protein
MKFVELSDEQWEFIKPQDEQGKTNFDCPANQAGLIDHIWSLREFLTFPVLQNSN